MKKIQNQDSKHSFGGGYLYNLLNKNIKEFNTIKLSIICILFLITVGIISYKINNSYALFTDEVTGNKTIELTPNTNLDTSGANPPILSSNMIPVYYDETSSTWKKADENNKTNKYKWYDYDEKIWANSVTVSETNRSKYQSANLGTEIPMDDILTMEVWIPRYKYKVFNYNSNGSITSSPEEIKIKWETDNQTTGEINCTNKVQGSNGDGTSETCKLNETNTVCTDDTCNDKYYTHPGFWRDENDNLTHETSEEKTGFWMGKFETTGSTTSITTLPNKTPITNTAVGIFYNNIQKMNKTNNAYGFDNTVDTYMARNMEWGAVSYLSHTKYGTCTKGVCTEVGINNKGTMNTSNSTGSGTITGCGSAPNSSASTTCNVYNQGGVIASTTGNIYGVYDMSGGNYEYVSASMIKSDGNFYAPTGITYGPSRKYHDYYSYGTTDTDAASRKRGKLGDASKETAMWYDDTKSQVYVSAYWMGRSLAFNNTNLAGIFSYHRISQTGSSYFSSRLVISNNN